MGRIFAILACGLILGPISAGEVQAQIDDHLKCYRIKDNIKLKGFVDLNSQQFGLEAGCKISRAKMFCVPVTKSNVEVGFNPLPIFGPPATGDRICYKVKCPGPQPPNTTASDQFGTHDMTKLKAFMLCTPAGKFTGPIPCDLSGHPTCAGECPDPNSQTCHPANDGTTECLCDEPCGFDAQGICGGDCAVATDICQLNSVIGKCDCGPVQTRCCEFVAGSLTGSCYDAVEPDATVACQQHGAAAILAPLGQVCNATTGTCGTVKDTGNGCCECTRLSPPYPNLTECWNMVSGSPQAQICTQGCTFNSTGLTSCSPITQMCELP